MEADTIAKLFIVGLVIYGTSLHEMGHAYVATWLGDPTPGKHGRLTWNPIPHLDPFLTAVVFPFVFYMFGNSLFCLAQTPIDPSRLRRPLRDHAIVALAGPVMNFLLAGILIGILWIPGAFVYHIGARGWTPGNWVTAIVPEAALWNIILGCFNLIPLPPLDGYRIARPIMPLPLRRSADDLARTGMLAMVIVMIVGGFIFRQFDDHILRFFQSLLPAPRVVFPG
jgi:Zn-dependent protease